MEDSDTQGRKQVVQTAVAALCLETGATNVERAALDAMCQLLESCKELVTPPPIFYLIPTPVIAQIFLK